MQSGKAPKVYDYYKDMQAPDIADMEIQLQQLVQQGVLSPEDAQAALVGDSEMKGISLDPNLKAAQMDALSGLQEISDGGGLTLSDEANLRKIQDQINTEARGSREAILQNAQARGLGGSGLELLSQMQNQQDAATRASRAGLDTAAQAQERALQALIQGGETAGNIRGQDFNEQAQIAQAQDAISKFNAQNQQQVNMMNTQSRNDAQRANLASKQGVSDANANLANQQQMYNKGLKQQDFDNRMAITAGRAGIANQNAANQAAANAARANAINQTIGAGLSAGAGLGAAYLAKKKDGGLVMGDPSDQDTMPHMLQPGEMVVRKEDVPDYLKKKHTSDKGDFDAAAFLDDITGHKYNYSKKGK